MLNFFRQNTLFVILSLFVKKGEESTLKNFTTRHSEPATAGEESTNSRHCVIKIRGYFASPSMTARGYALAFLDCHDFATQNLAMTA